MKRRFLRSGGVGSVRFWQGSRLAEFFALFASSRLKNFYREEREEMQKRLRLPKGVKLFAMFGRSKKLDFFYGGVAVGCFKGAAFPTRPGVYRYMPYHGAEHHQMLTLARKLQRPRCSFSEKKQAMSFAVADVPEEGGVGAGRFSKRRIVKTR